MKTCTFPMEFTKRSLRMKMRNSRLQSSRFRKAGSAVSVILECEARERLAPFSLAIFSLTPDLSFEYGPSLAFPRKYDCFAVYEILNCIWSNRSKLFILKTNHAEFQVLILTRSRIIRETTSGLYCLPLEIQIWAGTTNKVRAGGEVTSSNQNSESISILSKWKVKY